MAFSFVNGDDVIIVIASEGPSTVATPCELSGHFTALTIKCLMSSIHHLFSFTSYFFLVVPYLCC